MARFSRMQVLNAIYEISLVPVFYHGDFETARNVMAAVSRGGCKLVEFVNRGDHAYEIFSALETHFRAADPGLILGAGSILDPYTASLYMNAGANFIVGPTLNPEVAAFLQSPQGPLLPRLRERFRNFSGGGTRLRDMQDLSRRGSGRT